MSGHAHRRHSARLILAAVVACALAWLGVAAAPQVGPVGPRVPAGAEILVAQPLTQHVAQRVATHIRHVRAATVAASHRSLTGIGALRALAIALAVLLTLAQARRDSLPRWAVQMHGVRAPPAIAPDRAVA